MTKLFTTWLLLAVLSLDIVASNTPNPHEQAEEISDTEIGLDESTTPEGEEK